MPIRWRLCHGNILDQPADVLICSANVFLNLSGGVGGEMLLRCGTAAQDELHRWLRVNQRRFVSRGEVVPGSAHGLPFKAILHAVAVDGFYQSSPEIVRELVDKSLRTAASLQAVSISLTVLATGYGRLSMQQFGEAVAPLLHREYPPIAQVVICARNEYDEADLGASLDLPRLD